jgi:MinD superfamily P-loop ATPase
LALVVTEPTVSGLHDLDRVAALTKHFTVPALVCINKWDLNPQFALQIERQAHRLGLGVAGRVRYDRAVTDAQIRRQAVVEYQGNGCAEDMRAIWAAVSAKLDCAEGSDGNRGGPT